MFNQQTASDSNPFEAAGPAAAGQKHEGGLASQGPEWLQDDPRPGAAPQPVERVGIRQLDEKLPPLPKLVYLMRLVNIVITCLIAFVCVLKMMVVSSLSTGIIAIYLIMFSGMVTCFELQLKVIVKRIGTNFGFLYNAKGRAMFFLFIGILCFSLGFWGVLLGIAMLVNSLFNFYIIWKYPQYEEMALRTLEEETSEFLKSNPEMVASGAAAMTKATLQAQSSNNQQGVPV
mmetsp:Transcript_5547/g.7653  ORF Transcript_5547/g.7653 Transcript_5547/m.7653 type:complete len:231 (-) Transcript_5547:243-935(-)